jgi:serine/threonine-protein kinase PRP4
MLLLMMELKGRFNQKMVKKAKFGDSFFDEMGGFDSIERDRVTGAVSGLTYSLGIAKPGYTILLGRDTQSAHLETDTRPAREAHPTILRTDER